MFVESATQALCGHILRCYKLYEQLNSEDVVVFLNALQVDRKEGYCNNQLVP